MAEKIENLTKAQDLRSRALTAERRAQTRMAERLWAEAERIERAERIGRPHPRREETR